MSQIDNKLFGICSKNTEEPDQFIKVLMVFVNVQQDPNFWTVLNDGPITFIRLNDQPFAFAVGCVSDLALLDKPR